MTAFRTLTLMTAFFLLGVGSFAQPVQAANTIQACTSPNPDAWVNVCVTLTPTSTTLRYSTFNQNYATEEVCPVNRICVDVPVVPTLIKPWSYTVDSYKVQPSYSSNLGNVVEDVCNILGIVCNLAEVVAPTTAASASMPDLGEDVPAALPHGMVFEGFSLDASGYLAGVIFLMPDGEYVLVPLNA